MCPRITSSSAQYAYHIHFNRIVQPRRRACRSSARRSRRSSSGRSSTTRRASSGWRSCARSWWRARGRRAACSWRRARSATRGRSSNARRASAVCWEPCRRARQRRLAVWGRAPTPAPQITSATTRSRWAQERRSSRRAPLVECTSQQSRRTPTTRCSKWAPPKYVCAQRASPTSCLVWHLSRRATRPKCAHCLSRFELAFVHCQALCPLSHCCEAYCLNVVLVYGVYVVLVAHYTVDSALLHSLTIQSTLLFLIFTIVGPM